VAHFHQRQANTTRPVAFAFSFAFVRAFADWIRLFVRRLGQGAVLRSRPLTRSCCDTATSGVRYVTCQLLFSLPAHVAVSTGGEIDISHMCPHSVAAALKMYMHRLCTCCLLVRVYECVT